MPFTFSHPAIVLPFLKVGKSWISMSGLIIGSITPDFEYFIKMKLSGRYSHSLEGMFLFGLPVACAIAIVFHFLVKKPFIDNLPAYFYKRLLDLRDFDFLNYAKSHFISFVFCALIGIGSHIVWDSFTHANALERDFPFLATFISIFHVPLFRVLQHASTVIGACFIILVFHKLPIQQNENTPSYKFWFISFVTASFAFALRASLTFEYLGDIVCSIISAGFIGLIISSVFARVGWIKS